MSSGISWAYSGDQVISPRRVCQTLPCINFSQAIMKKMVITPSPLESAATPSAESLSCVFQQEMCVLSTLPLTSVCHLIPIILSWIIIFIRWGSWGPQVGILCRVPLCHGSGLWLLRHPYRSRCWPRELSCLPGTHSSPREGLSDRWTSQSAEDICDSCFDILPGGPSIVSCYWQVTAELWLTGSLSSSFPCFFCFPSLFINKPWPAASPFGMERGQVKVGAMESFPNLQFHSSITREWVDEERDRGNDNSPNSCCTIQLHYFS